MSKFVIFTLTALASTLMACSSAPTSNATNYGVPFVNRTLPERMIDEGIEHTILRNLPNISGMENVQNQQMRMAVDSFRREVLLTGEVPNPALSQNIHNMISSMNDVNKIYNYLTVGVPKTQTNTLQDNFLKSKILARLITDRSVKASQYKLVVRNSTVYIMGYLTQDQQNRIMEAIRQTQGIEQVVLLSNLVTYVDANNLPYVNTNYGNFNNNQNNINTGNLNNTYNNIPNTGNVYNNSNAYNNNNSYNGGTGYNNGNVYNNGTTNSNYNNGNLYNNQPYNNPYTNNPYTATTPKGNIKPTSSYVQLYSGTNMP